MGIDRIVETFLRDGTVSCPVEIFPKVKEILFEKLNNNEITEFSYNRKINNSHVLIVSSSWQQINSWVHITG